MYVHLGNTCRRPADVAVSRCYSRRTRVPSNDWCEGNGSVAMFISACSSPLLRLNETDTD